MNRTVITVFVVCLMVAGGVGATYYYIRAQKAQNQTVLTPVTVKYRHLTAEVNISGTSKASETVDLAFKNSGIVDTVSVVTGEFVSTSTALMTLRSNVLKNQLSQARANLSTQIARLNDLENGTRPEQIAVTQANLRSNKTTLEDAQRGLSDALESAQSEADVVVRFTIDKFIANPAMPNASLIIPASDSQLGLRVLSERQLIEPALSSWKMRVNSLQSASVDDLLIADAQMHSYLQDISAILGDLTQILANGSAQYASYQASVATPRTTITTINDALTAAVRTVQSAQASIKITEQQLELEKAGPTSEAVAAQRAIVNSARAQVSEFQDELKDQDITAPFSGIITNVDVRRGETVTAGEEVVSMISNGPLKIEGYVPEVHYGGIAAGEPVRIQLDAFPGNSFPGTLALVDPTAILRDGVPNFKVTVYFTNPDPRIRPGLTASAFIQTADKPSALSIPIASVTGTGNNATVMRLVGTTAERTPVVLGITSTDGYIEIVSGLSAGDTVLVDETKQYRIVPN